MSADGLPRFVIIGAVKGATTWVSSQLRLQPGVFVPRTEPHFFSSAYERGEAWYRELFAPAAPDDLVGEKSADYLAHPLAAGRLRNLLPDARLIVQLRNPVDRAYSDFCMLYRRGTVDGRVAEHLGPGSRFPRFTEDGFYWAHLARWLEHFDRSQLHVLLYDDILSAPDRELQMVAAHVGFAGRPALQPAERCQNDSKAPMLPLPVRKAMAPLKPAFAPLRTKPWFGRLHRSLARPVRYPPMTADIRRRLQDLYADDVVALGRFLGRDLLHWLEPPQRRVA